MKLYHKKQSGFTPSNTRKANLTGFTLLEMVIALGIFVTLFTLTLGIYSYALKAEIRTTQLSKLQKEAQLLMEVITKKVRNSRVDYSWYLSTPLDDPEDELALLDRSANITTFRLDDVNNTIEICTVDDCSDDADFVAIPASDVAVTDLRFFISPLINPCRLDALPTGHPRVTIVIELEVTKGTVTQTLVIQQTVPQRLGCY